MKVEYNSLGTLSDNEASLYKEATPLGSKTRKTYECKKEEEKFQIEEISVYLYQSMLKAYGKNGNQSFADLKEL